MTEQLANLAAFLLRIQRSFRDSFLDKAREIS